MFEVLHAIIIRSNCGLVGGAYRVMRVRNRKCDQILTICNPTTGHTEVISSRHSAIVR